MRTVRASAWMHVRLIAVGLCMSVAQGSIFAQVTWRKAYGAFADESCSSVRVIHDDLILAAGSTGSFGAGSSDIYLVAVDGNGSFLWSKTIGGAYLEQLTAMNICSNGDLIMSGFYYGDAEANYVGLLIRTTQEGEVLWQRTYGGDDWDFFNDVMELDDGGFIVAGETFSYGVTGSNAWVLRLDANGDTLWTHTYGVPGGQTAHSVDTSLDGGFIVGGGITNTSGDGNAWILKLDGSGNTLWSHQYGGAGEDVAYDVIPTMEGGYSFVGSTGSYSNWLRAYHVKLDGSGNVEWTKHWGGNGDQASYEVLELSSAEYIHAGYADLAMGGGRDMYLQKSWIDGEYVFGRSYGGLGDDVAYSLNAINEGYIVAGATTSFGSGGSDVFIVRTGLDGLTASQDVSSDFDALSILDEEMRYLGLSLYPNPSTGTFRISGLDPVAVRVLDMEGRVAAGVMIPAGTQDVLVDLPVGCYVVEAIDRKGVLRRGRLLIIHP